MARGEGRILVLPAGAAAYVSLRHESKRTRLAGYTPGDREVIAICEANAGRALSSLEIDFPAEVGRDRPWAGLRGVTVIDLLDIALAGGIHWTELVRRQIAAARMAEDPGAMARRAAGRGKADLEADRSDPDLLSRPMLELSLRSFSPSGGSSLSY
jgi:hypothetical protein